MVSILASKLLSSVRAIAFVAATLTIATMTAESAKADTFTFSFSNGSNGNVNGVVTGQILGLVNNSTSAATQVLITSFPTGLNSVLGNGLVDATTFSSQIQNFFTEKDGFITAGSFVGRDYIDGAPNGAQLFINGGQGGFNFLNLDGQDSLYVFGANGLAAANLQLLTTPVPEPASLALLATGLIGAGLARRRRAA